MSDLDKYRKILDHESSDLNDELAEFLKNSANANAPKGKSKEDIWNNIESEINESKASIPIWTYLSIAASIALIVTFVFIFSSNDPIVPKQLSFSTTPAESKTIDLPDGSQVILNASSTISYMDQWDRAVTLDGEAFFEVVKGGKFSVITNIGSVEVLGTSFNVYSRDSTFEVACKTGKIKVQIPSKSLEEPLTPGQTIRLETDTVKRSSLDTELVGKWQAGEFYFSEQRLSNVLKEVERQFNVSINLPDTTDTIFDGYFTNKDIDSALEMVCLPLGLTYEKTGQTTYAIKEPE
ncbi:FecR domain-containing protein [Ekhidna sp.]|uniref:FecR family protein n=1 Tax=Ekhidna sp. TaxID=2608089 RepID=UPI0032982571